MNNISSADENDRELFNRIASKYSKKDIYPVSQMVRKFQIDTAMDLLMKHSKKCVFENIIELGCGAGANSQYLKKYCRNYIGIDYSEELIKIADSIYSDNGITFRSSDILSFDPVMKYDLVLLIGVLHHLTDLEKNLDYIKKIGNENALYIFLEPQAKNPLIQILRFFRKIIDPSYSKTQRFFHKNELLALLNSASYEVKESRYTGYFSPPLAQVIMKPVILFYPIAKLLTYTDCLIQKFLPNRLSWNITIIAGKKTE